jgi:hypothetical protein
VALVVVVPGPIATPGTPLADAGVPGSEQAARRAEQWARVERRTVGSLASAVRAARGVLPAADRISVVDTAAAFAAPHPDTDPEMVARLVYGWWLTGVRAGQCPAPVGDPPTQPDVPEMLGHLGASAYFHRAADLPGEAADALARYLTDRKLRHEARVHVQHAISAATRVVIGYGVGALIAYEALCALGDTVSVRLVTLGGALCGPEPVYKRIEPPPRDGQGLWPAAVHHWHNLVAHTDLTALTAPQLTDRFGPGIDDELIEIRAGYGELHHYLLDRATGRAVAAGLT